MNQAIAESNAEQLFQTAHSLKSSSGYMGAPIMQQLAAQLERMGREGSVEGCEPFLAELVEEYQVLEPRLRSSPQADYLSVLQSASVFADLRRASVAHC